MKTGYHGTIFCFWTRLSILISVVWRWISKAQVRSICTGKQPSTWGDHSSVQHQKLIPTLLILLQNFWSHSVPHQLNLHVYSHITFGHFFVRCNTGFSVKTTLKTPFGMRRKDEVWTSHVPQYDTAPVRNRKCVQKAKAC